MKIIITAADNESSEYRNWYYDCIGMEFEVWESYEADKNFLDDKPRFWIRPESIPDHIKKDRKTVLGDYAVQFWHCKVVEEYPDKTVLRVFDRPSRRWFTIVTEPTWGTRVIEGWVNYTQRAGDSE